MNDRYLSRNFPTVTLLLAFALGLAGCGSDSAQRSADSGVRSEGREVFAGAPRSGSASRGPDTSGLDQQDGWAIVLRSITGDPTSDQVREALAMTRRQVGRSDVRAVRRSSGVAMVLGSYDRPDSREAKRDLERVRATAVGGRAIFRTAFLAPPERRIDAGSFPEYNLATARQRFGERAVWTLQIGVYESPDRAEAKKAAEEAVSRLRRDGEQAFYYHGTTRSMVTMGVFGHSDIDEFARPRSTMLAALMERYPRNLINGAPIIEKRPGQPDREQRSLLVRIPD